MPARHVLVTGASTGIGRATAILLHDRGLTVHGSVRRQADAEDLERDGIRPLLFDVVDDEATAAGVEAFRSAAGHDVAGVVANAGIAVPGPLEDITPADLQRQLEVNVVGVHRTVRPLIADLLAARGRIVLMGSIAGRVAAPLYGAYNASKFALEGYGDALRRELAPHGSHVAIIEPGPVATPIWEAFDPAEADQLTPRYREFARRYGTEAAANRHDAIRPEAVAEVVHHALTSRRPRARYCLPRDTRIISEVVPRLPTFLADRIVHANVGYR